MTEFGKTIILRDDEWHESATNASSRTCVDHVCHDSGAGYNVFLCCVRWLRREVGRGAGRTLLETVSESF